VPEKLLRVGRWCKDAVELSLQGGSILAECLARLLTGCLVGEDTIHAGQGAAQLLDA
jgi:hypothetical protein